MISKITDTTQWAKVEPKENQTLVTEDSKEIQNKCNNIIAKKELCFSSFVANNWMHINALENKHLLSLNKRGTALWLSSDGSFFFRRSPTDSIKKLEQSKMKTVLCNVLDLENINLFNSSKDELIDIKPLNVVLRKGD